jgi:hypothetical protein
MTGRRIHNSESVIFSRSQVGFEERRL